MCSGFQFFERVSDIGNVMNLCVQAMLASASICSLLAIGTALCSAYLNVISTSELIHLDRYSEEAETETI